MRGNVSSIAPKWESLSFMPEARRKFSRRHGKAAREERRINRTRVEKRRTRGAAKRGKRAERNLSHHTVH